MEKNGVVAIIASKATGEEAPIPIQAPVQASKAATIPLQTPIPASTIAAGEEAPASLGQIPHGWDPYKEEDYIRPKNPYDTSIADPWSEVDSSNVCSDNESMDTKTRQILRRLKSGQYDNFFVGDIYRFPFYTKSIATNFNSLVNHAEDMKTCGLSMNINNLRDKHQKLDFHLRNLQKVAIEEGRMPPINPKAPQVKGLGRNKWRKRQRKEAEALLAEAVRGPLIL